MLNLLCLDVVDLAELKLLSMKILEKRDEVFHLLYRLYYMNSLSEKLLYYMSNYVEEFGFGESRSKLFKKKHAMRFSFAES